jgi:hypothetical protein
MDPIFFNFMSQVWLIHHYVKIPIIIISTEKFKIFSHYLYIIYMTYFRLKCLNAFVYIFL